MRPLRWWQREWRLDAGPLRFSGTPGSMCWPSFWRYWDGPTLEFGVDFGPHGGDPFLTVGLAFFWPRLSRAYEWYWDRLHTPSPAPKFLARCKYRTDTGARCTKPTGHGEQHAYQYRPIETGDPQ